MGSRGCAGLCEGVLAWTVALKTYFQARSFKRGALCGIGYFTKVVYIHEKDEVRALTARERRCHKLLSGTARLKATTEPQRTDDGGGSDVSIRSQFGGPPERCSSTMPETGPSRYCHHHAKAPWEWKIGTRNHAALASYGPLPSPRFLPLAVQTSEASP